MKTPCILVASCSDVGPESIIKDILTGETLPERKQLIENVVGFDWHISTKYYTADILLCASQERTIGDQSFAESVEAFIVSFDADKVESFEQVKSWCPYLEQLEPEIKMLVCERCTENHKVTRLEAQTWCIDNGFELVELNPEVESDHDSDTEDDFVETTGIKRIVQALHAHTWPNLQMKDNPVHHSPYIRQLMKEEFESRQIQPSLDDTESKSETDTDIDSKIQPDTNHSKTNSEQEIETASNDVKADIVQTLSDKVVDDHKQSETDSGSPLDCTGDAKVPGASATTPKSSDKKVNKKEVKPPSKEETIDSLLQSGDMALFESLGDDDPGGESFEKLFESFGRMKERAKNLPHEERKKYAEHVAVAFWRAIGGDEDEIGSLSDSD